MRYWQLRLVSTVPLVRLKVGFIRVLCGSVGVSPWPYAHGRRTFGVGGRQVFVETIVATPLASLLAFVAVGYVLVLVVHVFVLVPQVIHDARELEVAFAQARHLQAVAQVYVLAAPSLVELIVAVDPYDV